MHFASGETLTRAPDQPITSRARAHAKPHVNPQMPYAP
jgi:hypothetical protein